MQSIHGSFVLAAALVALFAGTPARADGAKIAFDGRVADALGHPFDATTDITFRLYDAPSGGHLVHIETQHVTISKGMFVASFGAAAASDLAQVQNFDSLWLSAQIGKGPEAGVRSHLVHQIVDAQ